MNPQIDALLREYDGVVPGAALLVVHNAEPLIRVTRGLACIESGIAATPATNYRLASVSKQFTAAAILLNVQDGRLGLDDRARRWLPTLPRAADRITIRQMLTHTSGVMDYEEAVPASLARQLRDADVLAILETQDRTYFAPGSGYRYSNSGYALLALIVECASGLGFATFLRERIFLPLGMTGTVAHEEGISNVGERAYGYSRVQDSWTRTDQGPTTAVLGDGGIYSSIDDLAKWDAALDGSRLLRPDLWRLAFTPATGTDEPGVRYGFGWRISGQAVGHTGESLGFRTALVRYPSHRLTVVLLTNRNEGDPGRTAQAIARIVLPSCAADP